MGRWKTNAIPGEKKAIPGRCFNCQNESFNSRCKYVNAIIIEIRDVDTKKIRRTAASPHTAVPMT